MKISPVTFGKNYIRQIRVPNKKEKKVATLNFVQYENKISDKDQLKAETKKRFRNIEGFYASAIYEDFTDNMAQEDSKVKFFGIEDDDGKIQALMEVHSNVNSDYQYIMPKKQGLEISLMCVSSDNKHRAQERKYQGLGAQLVSGAIRQAMDEDSDFIILENKEDEFWSKMPYFQDFEYGSIKVLDSKDFAKCATKLDKKG